MRGTKLWQQAGSPIIQGRSRTEHQFWQDWLGAMGLALALYMAVDAIVSPPPEPLTRALTTIAGSALACAQLAIVPTALGTWISRTLRISRPWLLGGVLGALVAAGLMWSWGRL